VHRTCPAWRGDDRSGGIFDQIFISGRVSRLDSVFHGPDERLGRMGQVRLVSVKLILCARATTGASYNGFKIDQIGGITAPYPPTRS